MEGFDPAQELRGKGCPWRLASSTMHVIHVGAEVYFLRYLLVPGATKTPGVT